MITFGKTMLNTDSQRVDIVEYIRMIFASNRER